MWVEDPAAWVGLATLVVLEIVLGIDNLVFIAILADKLPQGQKDKARVLGLSLALAMRFVLLASIAWIVTLTKPLFIILDQGFSGRDIILILGGIFLLFKGTMELHERREGHAAHKEKNKPHAVFWQVIVQIVILDAIFSLDSVITAVGMIDHLAVMMIAVTIAIGVMMARLVQDKMHLTEKENFIATRKGILRPEELSLEERNELIKKQPAYGNIICRCEMISEGEILDAIHRPLGARSLDAIKRRTRAGMGRCQAGFCSPRTMEILSREVPMEMTDISKCGGSSQFVYGYNKEIQEEMP